MAKQESILKFVGNMDGLSFYKNKNGYAARKKGGVSGSRIKNDPRFERTRENIEEFGRAATASKLLRSALRATLANTRDSAMTPRLTKMFLQVVKTDPVNRRGKREVVEGDFSLLKGFEFNIASPLDRTLYAVPTLTFNRDQGSATITIPPIVPAHAIVWPEGATHCVVISSAVELDFTTNDYGHSSFRSDAIEKDSGDVAELVIQHTVTPQSGLPIVLTLGVEFYQLMNGEHYPLKNGAFNSLSLVAADGGE